MAQLNKNYSKFDIVKFLDQQAQKLDKQKIDSKTKNVLQLKNINKVYDNGFQAIFGINLEVKKGEFLSLLGPSGCGKSTTLRIIAGLEQLSQGHVFINNIDVSHIDAGNRNLTMVFQNYALFPHLNVKNNIAFSLKANRKKVGQSGQIWQQIIFLKNQIFELNNTIYTIKHLDKFDKEIQNLTTKMANWKNKLSLLQEEQTSKKHQKKLFHAKTKLIYLKSSLEAKKEYFASVQKQKMHLKNLLEKRDAIKKEIKTLDIKRKEIYAQENQKEIINQKVAYAAKVLGLEYYLNAKPAELSGGQRQRIALGRSIVNNPSLFLMDEPLSNLDAKLRASMRQEIRMLHEKINSGTIYVTHDQVEAMTMSDKLAVMQDGFILQLGAPKEVFKNPSCLFVAGFVGSPAMNFIEGYYENGVFSSNNGLKIALPPYKTINLIDKQKITIGIRPSDFSSDENVYNAYKIALKLQITHKELLGNEVQYQAKIIGSNEKVVFVTSSYEDYAINDVILQYLITSRMHIFDSDSTIALSSEFNLETINALKHWTLNKNQISLRNEILQNSKKKSHKSSWFNFLKAQFFNLKRRAQNKFKKEKNNEKKS